MNKKTFCRIRKKCEQKKKVPHTICVRFVEPKTVQKIVGVLYTPLRSTNLLVTLIFYGLAQQENRLLIAISTIFSFFMYFFRSLCVLFVFNYLHSYFFMYGTQISY